MRRSLSVSREHLTENSPRNKDKIKVKWDNIPNHNTKKPRETCM